MHGFARIIVTAVVLAVGTGTAWAEGEKRVALVIGNSVYEHASRLANPRKDAEAVAAALGRIGFDASLVTDLSAEGLRSALGKFNRRAVGADTAVIFFSGHGIEVNGRNYLVPVDAQLSSSLTVEFEAVSIDLLQAAVQGAKRLRLVILDACRDNPFRVGMQLAAGATKSVTRGLERVEPVRGTLIAFAARDGTVALDGEGPNSPYTTALLEHIETPGLDVGQMFRLVRDRVLDLTGNVQEPFVYGSIPGGVVALTPGQAPRLEPQPEPGRAEPPGFDERALDLAFWNSMKDSKDRRQFEAYLSKYPDGAFAAIARRKIEELEETEVAVMTPPQERMTLVSPDMLERSEITFPSGSVYEGDTSNGRMHGKGKITYANGGVYEGDFVDDKITGQGTFVYPNGDRYEGGFLVGKREGEGTFWFANGSRYEGSFGDGQMHGQGKLTFASGAVYEGDFVDGRREGQGELRFPNGDRYVGSFWNSQKHGEGRVEYAEGHVYEGEFANGHRHGQGTMRAANGEVYTGQYARGERHGQGTFTQTDGVQYVGEYVAGKREGRGVVTYPNGDRYEGSFADDLLHGAGVLFYEDGTRVEMTYYNNVPSGTAVWIYPDGLRIKGKF